MTLWLAIAGIAVAWIAANAVLIIMQRRPAASTIAWLMGLVFLPVIGWIAYVLIGPLRLKRKKHKRTLGRQFVDEGLRGLAALDQDSEEHHQLAMVSVRVGGAPPLQAAEVEIYLDGATTYDAILAAIAQAKHHVHVEYYIWDDDHIGKAMRDALIERAKAGVAVRVILDGTGVTLSNKFLRPLREAGAKAEWFNPIRLRTLRSRRIDFRSHRKIVIVDGTVGFTGGMNVSDYHSEKLSKEYWRDTHLKLTGAAVWPMQRMFFEDWYFVAEELIPIDERTGPAPARRGEHLVQVVGSGPDAGDFAIHKVFFTAINQATKRCWIVSPYFVPDDALLTALVTAALRGVDVRVLVPRKGDSRLVDWAARSYFPELLEAKVKVYEYTPRFIHAKTMLCDDDIAIVGTCNFDNRSFRLDFELIAILFGPIHNQTLAESFLTDLASSHEVVAAELAKLSFGKRFAQNSARLMSPLL